jgi:uncharacterized protein YndB with AHSA1/START domain
MTVKPDAAADLTLTRDIAVPPEKVWAAWTRPELVKRWFTPRPWETAHCEIDLRPGGIFRTVLRGPDGPELDNTGCWLEVVPNRRLVWTVALLPGYRPNADLPHGLSFTAVITFEPLGAGTRYAVTAMHPSAEAARRHADMGFHQGWGAALDQLVELLARG